MNLTPFAIVGDDTLYAQHNTDGALDLYDPATDQGQLTQEWLTDRSAMLSWTLLLNTEDIVTSAGNPYNPSGTPAQYFEDKTTQDTLTLGPREINNTNANRRRFLFGRDQTDGSTETLTSGTLDDRLYGGAGDNFILDGGNLTVSLSTLAGLYDYNHLLKSRRWRRPEGSAKQSGQYLQIRESGVDGRAA